MSNRNSQKQVEERLKTACGEKYSFLPFEYYKNKQKITFICSEHGNFQCSVDSFLRGCRCRLCGYARDGNALRCTLEKFIEKAKNVHGDRYDYSLSEYKTAKLKIKIICKKHGPFFQVVSGHLNGQGCVRCHHGDRSSFENYQIRDQIKRDYCIINNILLLEIPYFEENVESVVLNFLNQKSLENSPEFSE